MHKVNSILLLLLCVALPLHAAEQKRPTKMTFSYVKHPTMVNYLIPLIKASYKKLNIDTHFVPQPSNRNLRLVEDNKVDGDVGICVLYWTNTTTLLPLNPRLY